MFGVWDDAAGVRVSPRRIFRDERDAGRRLFPASELPFLAAIEAELSEHAADFLIAQRLYEYLNFTLHLETRLVNRSLITLAHGIPGVALSGQARLDAYRIYTDEAYHATCALDMMQQIAGETGHAPLPYRFTAIDDLDCAADELERLAPGLAQLLQATVFETTITSILSAIPHDESVVSAVRELVADHAADERRHHAYFARLFPQIWAECDRATRLAAGPYLAHVIAVSLAPDIGHATAMLMAAGIPANCAAKVIADVYTQESIAARNRLIARHTLHLLAAHDVLKDPATSAAFAEHGLLGGC